MAAVFLFVFSLGTLGQGAECGLCRIPGKKEVPPAVGGACRDHLPCGRNFFFDALAPLILAKFLILSRPSK